MTQTLIALDSNKHDGAHVLKIFVELETFVITSSERYERRQLDMLKHKADFQ